MAFAASSIQGQSCSGLGPEVKNTYKGDGSTSYVNGQLLTIMSDGTADPVAGGAATTVGIHLVYTGPTLTASTTDYIDVARITSDTLFYVQAIHSTPRVVVQGDLGEEQDLVIASGIWGVNLETATSGREDLEITQIYDNARDYDTASDESGTSGIVQVKVLNNRLNIGPV